MEQTMQRRKSAGRRGNVALGVLPPGRTVGVRSLDGTRLHTEVFGPEDSYPIVLSHGITCAIRYWAPQISDLSRDHRVIAFDHRGHGRSGVSSRGGYTLDLLAADLDAVLDATLRPGERAVIAGHSMGGVAIASWARRYPDAVVCRADAVALVNTLTGDMVREIRLLQVPERLAIHRIRIAHGLMRRIGPLPVVRGTRWTTRQFVALLAVGTDADPAASRLVHELFAATPPAGRGGCAQMLVDALGAEHISLDGLTVPTLVIGGEKDRLTPITQSRRIAGALPNLMAIVELPGGHCSNLERPDEVNRLLRELVDYAAADRRATS
jgi:pimeloyl-ACP methyl ester carboxylesterase